MSQILTQFIYDSISLLDLPHLTSSLAVLQLVRSIFPQSSEAIYPPPSDFISPFDEIKLKEKKRQINTMNMYN